jgi:hypothetical protein
MLFNQILFTLNLTIITLIIFLQSYNEHHPKSQNSIQEQQQLEFIQKLQAQEQSSKSQTQKIKITLKYLKSYYQQKEYLRNFDPKHTLLDLLDEHQTKINLKSFKQSDLIKNLNQIHYQNPAKLYQLFLLGNLAAIAIDTDCDQKCAQKIKSWFHDTQVVDIQKFLAQWLTNHPILQVQEKRQSRINPQLIDWALKGSLTLLIILIFISIKQIFDFKMLASKAKDRYLSLNLKDSAWVFIKSKIRHYIKILIKYYEQEKAELNNDADYLKEELKFIAIKWLIILAMSLIMIVYKHFNAFRFDIQMFTVDQKVKTPNLRSYQIKNNFLKTNIDYFSKQYPTEALSCKNAKNDQNCADLILPEIKQKVKVQCNLLKQQIQKIADISMINDKEVITFGSFSCDDEVKSSDLLKKIFY